MESFSSTKRIAISLFVCFAILYFREGRVALSMGHPRGTHSRNVIGCCLIPLGSCGLKAGLKITRDELPMEWGVYGGCLLCPFILS